MNRENPPDENGIQFVRDLYPDLDEVELREAEERVLRYLKIAIEIHERKNREQTP